MLISDINFRDMYHQIFIICLSDLSPFKKAFEYDEHANGVMVYGYIDHDAGLTFEVLSCVAFTQTAVRVYGGNDVVSFKLRSGNISDEELLFPEDTSTYEKLFAQKINDINESYKCSVQIEDTRELEVLDDCRHRDYPDDVLVLLFKDGLQPEGCWVRCSSIGRRCVKGILLNEPDGDFPVHSGDEILFLPTITDEYKIICEAYFDD